VWDNGAQRQQYRRKEDQMTDRGTRAITRSAGGDRRWERAYARCTLAVFHETKMGDQGLTRPCGCPSPVVKLQESSVPAVQGLNLGIWTSAERVVYGD